MKMMPQSKPWQNKSKLYELYHNKNMNKSEIAEKLGCSDTTIKNWIRKLGIPETKAWKRKSVLNYLYNSEGMTQEEISGLFNINQTTVGRELENNNIESKTRRDYTQPSFYFDENGYLTCRHRDGESRKSFKIHRLVAVSYFGFGEVDGKIVHHKNRHTSDNRIDNLETMSKDKHTEIHHKNKDILSDY